MYAPAHLQAAQSTSSVVHNDKHCVKAEFTLWPHTAAAQKASTCESPYLPAKMLLSALDKSDEGSYELQGHLVQVLKALAQNA